VSERPGVDSLRVGLDVTALIGPPTGIHQVTAHLLDALVAADIDVRGWMLSARGRPPRLDVPVRRSFMPARVAHLGWSRSRHPTAAMLAGPVDVVHGPNFLAPPGPRSVVTVQDITPLRHPDWVAPEVAAMATPLRRAVASGTTVHVTSAMVADEVRAELGVADDQLVVVPLGLDPLPDDTPVPGPDHHPTAGAPYVLVLGTTGVRKRVPAAVRALAESGHGDVHLVVAGPEGDDEATLRTSVRTHGLGDRFHRIATVDDSARVRLLAGARLVAFPSRYEGYGLPPLEALASGIPTVATAVGALPELIGADLELCRPGDDDGFAAAVRTALDADPVVADELRQRLRALTWERTASELIGVYRRLAGQDGSPASR